MQSANFIKDNSRLTERAPLDVIIKEDEGARKLFVIRLFSCAYGHCVIFTVRMKD